MSTKNKKYYAVVVDVTTTFRTQVEAKDELEAEQKALALAHEDTWMCDSSYDGANAYSIERVTAQGLPWVSWNSMSPEELLEEIKKVTGCENPVHLMNHIKKSESIYQERLDRVEF